MTTNAVNFMNNKMKLDVEKQIADLDRKVDFEKLGISKDELMEKIRHNKVDEYLQEKKVDADDRNGFMNGLGSILKGVGIGGAIGGLAAAVNDESYHNKLTVAYDQATKLPFSEKAGNPHNWNQGGIDVTSYLKDPSASTVFNSGIVSIQYIPTIAVTDQEIQSSELQNNVRLLFSAVRQANSGAINQYDQSDLFQFTLASSSVFEMLRLLVRPLNYINAKRKNMNVFTAWDEHILSVMTGSVANAKKVIDQKTEYIQAINSCIRAANAQALPIGFDLTKRRSLLNGRIFCHNGDRDEIYIFRPTCYYVYDEANAKLTCKQFDPSVVFASPDAAAAVLKEMLQPLVNGTATSVMTGDMKKAFPRQVQVIREIPYALKGDIYSEDEHILEAIRNANVMGNIPTYGSAWDIKQGVNESLDTYIYQGVLHTVDSMKKAWVYGDPHIFADGNKYNAFNAEEIDGKVLPYTNILDVKKDVPEKYDIMASTRFKTTFSVKFIDNTIDPDDAYISATTYLYQWGTEVITNVTCSVFHTQAYFNNNELYVFGCPNSDYNEYLNVLSLGLIRESLYKRFHYLPMVFKDLYIVDSYDDSDLTYIFDETHVRYNDVVLTDLQLLHLHNASFGSLISILQENPTEVE